MEYKVNLSEMEYKALSASASEADDGLLVGYASTWSVDSQNDQIEPKAFSASIVANSGRVPLFLDHNRERWAGSSLSLVEDQKGLLMRAQLYLDTASGKEAQALLRSARDAGFPVGLSIGIVVKQARFESGTRRISEVDLWEISLTPWPSNPQARAA